MTDDELLKLGQYVAEQQNTRLAATEPSESSRRFLAEYAARRAGPESAPKGQRPLFARPWLRLSLAALVVCGIFALKEAVFWNPPLSFTVGSSGQSGVLRDWESAPDDAPLPIRFSDGSLVKLEPRARARVVAVGRAGAEIVIESGRAHISVVPVGFRVPGESPWLVSLGPFSVEVKGTRFDVAWDPRSDQFSLDLYEGSVHMNGCVDSQSHTLVAGQGIRASCSRKQWTVVSLTEAASAAADVERNTESNAVALKSDNTLDIAPGSDETELSGRRDAGYPGSAARNALPEAAGQSPRGAHQRAQTQASAPRSRRAEPSWQALARDGHFSAAYEVALGAGFDAECERVPADDLPLLGDAARLNDDAERARAAYLAARRRFPGGAAAARAAFALGRMSVNRDPEEATHWFERYLGEQPKGPLAPAANDWLFELAVQSKQPARGREAARVYLERHARGAHAADARRILDAAKP